MKTKHSLRLHATFFVKIAAVIFFLNGTFVSFSQGIFKSNASGNWNSSACWTLTGGSDADGIPDANDDVTVESHSISLTVSTGNQSCNNIIVQASSTSTADGLLDVSGSILSVGGNFTFQRSGATANYHCDAQISGTGRINVAGNFLASRSATDTRNRRLRVYVLNSGRMDVSGTFTYNYLNDRETQTEILLENSGQLNVTGTFTIFYGDASGNDPGADEFLLNLNGGGSLTCGDFVASISGSNTNSASDILFQINGGSVTTHNFSAAHNGPSDDVLVYLNNLSTATPASLTVNGNFSIDHNSKKGDDMIVQTNMNSTISIAGTAAFNINSTTDNDQIYLDMNGGAMSVGGLTTFYIASSVTNANERIYINQASLNLNGGMLMKHYGGGAGDIYLYMNNANYGGNTVAAALNITGDLTIDNQFGDNVYIETNTNSAANISGNFNVSVNSLAGINVLYLQINNGTFTVNGNMTSTFSGGGAQENLNIRINNSGKFNVNNDVVWSMATGGNIFVYMNNVSGTNAEFNVGRDMIISHSAAAGDILINPRQNSKFTVGRDFMITHSATGGDYFDFSMDDSPTVTIGRDLSVTMIAGSNATMDDIILDVNGGTLSVSGNMNIKSDAGDDAELRLDNSASVTIGGNLWMNSVGGDQSSIYLGRTSGSPTLTVTGSLILDASIGNAELEANQSSVVNVRGNISMIAAAAGQILIDLNATSMLRIGGNFVRAAFPSMFGTLDAANGTIVKYDGNAAQIIAQDAGSGGDYFHYGGITIDNSLAGVGPHLTMEGPATVNGNLQLTDGIIQTTYASPLAIADNATASSGSPNSFIDGPLRKLGDDAFVFPIGDIVGGTTDVWARLEITAPTSGSSQFTAEYFGIPYSDLTVDATLNNASGIEYWQLNHSGSLSNINVTLYWEDAVRSAILNTTSNDLVVARYNGTDWINNGQNNISGSNFGFVQSSLVSAFNTYFTFGSTSGNNPLPVEFFIF